MNRCRASVVSRESMGQGGIGEQALGRALARSGDGVCAVSPQGRIVLWNPAAERIFEWSAREVLGRACCEVLVGADGDGNRLCYQGCHVMSLVNLGEPVQHFEMRTRTKAGRRIWIDTTILEAPRVNGERATVIHLFRDVTATRELLSLVPQRSVASSNGNGNGNGNETAGLTKRELEILRLMAAGANTKVLAERLHVSPATIRNHAQNIFSKLDVHSRLEAAAWANQHRLV